MRSASGRRACAGAGAQEAVRAQARGRGIQAQRSRTWSKTFASTGRMGCRSVPGGMNCSVTKSWRRGKRGRGGRERREKRERRPQHQRRPQ